MFSLPVLMSSISIEVLKQYLGQFRGFLIDGDMAINLKEETRVATDRSVG